MVGTASATTQAGRRRRRTWPATATSPKQITLCGRPGRAACRSHRYNVSAALRTAMTQWVQPRQSHTDTGLTVRRRLLWGRGSGFRAGTFRHVGHRVRDHLGPGLRRPTILSLTVLPQADQPGVDGRRQRLNGHFLLRVPRRSPPGGPRWRDQGHYLYDNTLSPSTTLYKRGWRKWIRAGMFSPCSGSRRGPRWARPWHPPTWRPGDSTKQIGLTGGGPAAVRQSYAVFRGTCLLRWRDRKLDGHFRTRTTPEPSTTYYTGSHDDPGGTFFGVGILPKVCS